MFLTVIWQKTPVLIKGKENEGIGWLGENGTANLTGNLFISLSQHLLSLSTKADAISVSPSTMTKPKATGAWPMADANEFLYNEKLKIFSNL